MPGPLLRVSARYRARYRASLGPAGARRELVVGCIHGNEAAGVAVARKLEGASPPGSRSLDLAGAQPGRAGRRDARECACRRSESQLSLALATLGAVFNSGPAPLSEPESRIASRLIRRLRPQVSIWFHQHLDVVDSSGRSVAVERRFAALVGLRLVRLPREPGSVVGWENHSFPGTTAFVVELPPGKLGSRAVGRFADATLAVGGRDRLRPG